MSIYVIDDHPLMRDALSMVLRRVMPGVKIVELDRLGLLDGAVQAHGQPELVCLDLNLPDTRGCTGVATVKAHYADVPLAVYSASPAQLMGDECLSQGADIYLEKATDSARLADSLRALIRHDDEADEPWTDTGPVKLTKRQVQLIGCLAEGMSNRTISERLAISEDTVKVHMWRLFKRLGVNSRTQALHHARQNGLLPP